MFPSMRLACLWSVASAALASFSAEDLLTLFPSGGTDAISCNYRVSFIESTEAPAEDGTFTTEIDMTKALITRSIPDALGQENVLYATVDTNVTNPPFTPASYHALRMERLGSNGTTAHSPNTPALITTIALSTKSNESVDTSTILAFGVPNFQEIVFPPDYDFAALLIKMIFNGVATQVIGVPNIPPPPAPPTPIPDYSITVRSDIIGTENSMGDPLAIGTYTGTFTPLDTTITYAFPPVLMPPNYYPILNQVVLQASSACERPGIGDGQMREIVANCTCDDLTLKVARCCPPKPATKKQCPTACLVQCATFVTSSLKAMVRSTASSSVTTAMSDACRGGKVGVEITKAIMLTLCISKSGVESQTAADVGTIMNFVQGFDPSARMSLPEACSFYDVSKSSTERICTCLAQNSAVDMGVGAEASVFVGGSGFGSAASGAVETIGDPTVEEGSELHEIECSGEQEEERKERERLEKEKKEKEQQPGGYTAVVVVSVIVVVTVAAVAYVVM